MHAPDPSHVAAAVPAENWADFVARVHARLDLDAVVYVLVNEGRRLLRCDRLSFALRAPRGPELVGVSGAEQVDRRANVVRLLGSFLGVAALRAGTFEWGDGGESPEPQVEAVLAPLIDAAHARRLVVVPVAATRDVPSAAEPEEPLGWLVAECFSAERPVAELCAAAETAARLAAPALTNARDYRDLPLRRLGEALRGWTSRRAFGRTAVRASLVVLAAAALLLVRTDLRIEARGTLEPRARRHVFAPVDGVVVDLDATHGRFVAAGERLLTMRRPELEFDITRVGGELETARRRLASVQAARLRGPTSAGSPTDDLLRLTAEEEELRQRTAGLQQQYDELLRRRDSLVVAAPIAGQVLTWDPARRLEGRPVPQGSRLLTIGDVAGRWELDLRIDDEYVGYVRAASRDSASLPVRFVAASAAERSFTATLDVVAAAADNDPDGRTRTAATALVDAAAPPDVLRPGSAVVAEIECGRAAIGYVWFLDVVHWLRTRLWF